MSLSGDKLYIVVINLLLHIYVLFAQLHSDHGLVLVSIYISSLGAERLSCAGAVLWLKWEVETKSSLAPLDHYI